MDITDPSETQTPTVGNILCYLCGTPIQPNATNMCVACLRTQVDITEAIPKSATLTQCKSCDRLAVPPSQWQVCAPESKELLAVCLKRLKGLNQVRLIDASFVWTEPHSRRVKVKLTVQKEVMQGAVLQQTFVVEYTVQTQMCDHCQRGEAKDFWRGVVQVRQKAEHKKTFYYLEQLILKHKAHAKTVNIKQMTDGVDFFFSSRSDAKKFQEFVMASVPCKFSTSEQLLSHDPNNNIYNYKYTFSVEIVPICKDDVVCLPKATAQALGSISQLCICTRVTSMVQLIDPRTGQVAELSGALFWREPFRSICSQKRLNEFVIMNAEYLRDTDSHGRHSEKAVVADVWVVRSSELGRAEATQVCARSHLGHLLGPGDSALGFDLANSNVNEPHFEAFVKKEKDRVPDVILVKKVFADRATRKRARQWKLRRMQREGASASEGSAEVDYQDFLEDLEEDPNVRQGVNIFRDPNMIPVEMDNQDQGMPKISLQEMLEGLNLKEEETADETEEGMGDTTTEH